MEEKGALGLLATWWEQTQEPTVEGQWYSLSRGSFIDLFPQKIAEEKVHDFLLYISLRNSESPKSKIPLSLKGAEKKGGWGWVVIFSLEICFFIRLLVSDLDFQKSSF